MSRGISFGSNIYSLTTQRQLSKASADVAKSLERLSTGLRINHASDDAAGLSIASRLSLDSRVYAQGIRNVNDSISLLNIAQGAISNYGTIVTRIKELSEQAANGSYSTTQRTSLNAEANSLITEYNRLAQSTSFNGMKLLDGTLSNFVTQLGDSTLAISVGQNVQSTVGTGSFTDKGAIYSLTFNGSLGVDIATGDFNGDGRMDTVQVGNAGPNSNYINVSLSQSNGTYTTTSIPGNDNAGGYPPGFTQVKIGDINGDGKLDIVALGDEISSSLAGYNTGVVQTFLGTGTGSFTYSSTYYPIISTAATNTTTFISLGDLNGDGKVDLVSEYFDGNAGTSTGVIALGNGSGGFSTSSTFALGGSLDENAGILRDLNGDGKLDLVTTNSAGTQVRVRLGTGSGTFGAATSYTGGSSIDIGDVNNDGKLDIISGSATNQYVLLGTGTGTFTASSTLTYSGNDGSITKLGDLNGDGNLDIVSKNSIIFGNGDGTFRYVGTHATSLALSLADGNGDGAIDIFSINSSDVVSHFLQANTTNSPLLQNVDLTTRAGALSALTFFNAYQTKLNNEIGSLGASQARFATALESLQATKLNYDTAYSRITDADIAAESASLVKNKILQNVASAVLAQANLAPEIGLKLLQG